MGLGSRTGGGANSRTISAVPASANSGETISAGAVNGSAATVFVKAATTKTPNNSVFLIFMLHTVSIFTIVSPNLLRQFDG